MAISVATSANTDDNQINDKWTLRPSGEAMTTALGELTAILLLVAIVFGVGLTGKEKQR
jgi:hypothetical protein